MKRALVVCACVAFAVWLSPGSAAGEVGRLSDVVGAITAYTVRAGESLSLISARFGVDVASIIADNGLRPRTAVQSGQTLLIDNRHIVPGTYQRGTLLINVPQRILFAENGAGDVIAYPVAVGRPGWQTPTRSFVVTSKETNPTWDVPPSILEESRQYGREQPPKVPPGPHNPLGSYWIGLSLSGIGIHGTNAPSSIFRTTTHGCIRMQPEDIQQLFARVQVGSPGEVIYEPALLTFYSGAVYLEIHRDIYGRRDRDVRSAVRALAAASALSELIDWGLADAVIAARHGVARDVTRRTL